MIKKHPVGEELNTQCGIHNEISSHIRNYRHAVDINMKMKYAIPMHCWLLLDVINTDTVPFK